MVVDADRRPTAVKESPDPTQRTVETVYREIAALRDALEARVQALNQRIEDKFHSIKEAVELLQALADRSPTTMDVQAIVVALKELMLSKFEHNATALDAALRQREKATDKLEETFLAQLNGNTELTRSQFKSIDEKIADLNTRLTTAEGRTKGIGDSWGVLLGAVGFIVALISVAAFIFDKP